jgi:hypothetical protein
MLQPGRQLRYASVLEGFDEKVLAVVDRIDNVLQPEKVGFASHVLLFTQSKKVGTEKVPAEVQVGLAIRIVNQIAVIAFETQVADRLLGIDAVPALGRNSVYLVNELDVFGHRLREQEASGHHTLEAPGILAKRLDQSEAGSLPTAVKERSANTREPGGMIAKTIGNEVICAFVARPNFGEEACRKIRSQR